MPAVQELARRFQTRGLRVMGVTTSGEDEAQRKAVAEAAHEEKMTWPTLLDPQGEWGSAAGVGSIPTFLVVNKDGLVIYRHAGKLVVESDGFAALASAIDRALAGS